MAFAERAMARSALAVVIAVTGASVLAACGSSSSSSSNSKPASTSPAARSQRVTITPQTGGPSTAFSLQFIAPASSALDAGSTIGYSIGLTGPRATSCIGSRSLPVAAAIKGRPVAVALDPATLGGRWCVGSYAARVIELQRPACAAGTMCPQYVRVVGVVGRASFRVTQSG